MNNPSKLYPLVITKDLDRTRTFYRDRIGCDFTHDMPGYLQVRFGDAESAPELAFMKEDGTHAGFAGEGLIVSVPTADADAKHEELERRETPITAAPSDKPWRWRSFVVTDPNGVMLDFFHPLADADAEDAAS